MTTVEYRIKDPLDLLRAKSDFTYQLVESRYHRQRLDLVLHIEDKCGHRIVFEFLALMRFYGAGHLKEYDQLGQDFAFIRRDVIDEELVIETDTLILGDVDAGSTIVIKNRLIVCGTMAGTAVLKGKRASIEAKSFLDCKVVTPNKTFSSYRAEDEVIRT